MASAFIAKLVDKLHRIYIPKEVWELEQLSQDDFVEITIKKINK
jgi:bifunctional DNA-binding transcriptional regulator/antitoxin component of YhaV-PrlF toxin-antitoxin module